MTLLPIHIIAGLIGLVSGAVALYAAKGANLHRRSGMIFVYAMLVVAISGTVMGSRIAEMAAVLPGMLTFYLVLTSLLTVRRPAVLLFPWADLGVMLVGLAVSIASTLLGINATSTEGGLAFMYFLFGIVSLLAVLGDLRVIFTKGIQGTYRIARHLWRMCVALLLASISLLLGQSQAFPEPLRSSGLLPIPVLLVLLLMVYWLIRVLFTPWYRRVYQQAPVKVSVARPTTGFER